MHHENLFILLLYLKSLCLYGSPTRRIEFGEGDLLIPAININNISYTSTFSVSTTELVSSDALHMRTALFSDITYAAATLLIAVSMDQ